MNAFQAMYAPEKAPPRDTVLPRIALLPVDRLCPAELSSRQKCEADSIIKLADSIRINGILQPLTVRILNSDGFYGNLYEIVAGERRYRAAKLLGMDTVPCVIVRADDLKTAELSLVENIQRESLDMFEIAGALASMIDMYGLTQDELSRRLSVSQSFIANKLRILRLTLPEREKIIKYGLTERHARALLRVASAEQRLRIIEYINRHSLNVATTESYIDRYLSENATARNPRSPGKIILKDIRIFYNSVDRAISMVRQAGVAVESSRKDLGDSVELTIRVHKTPDVSRETFERA